VSVAVGEATADAQQMSHARGIRGDLNVRLAGKSASPSRKPVLQINTRPKNRARRHRNTPVAVL
jgi:hypothetical protein